MPRHARVMLAGVPVHIIQRGHNRDAIFFDAADYALYLQHLETLAAEFGCAVHANCLMSNHVHLLLTPASAAACDRLMKQLSQCHAQYVNRTQRRSGGLWEGRFRSCLTDSERYLLACHAYIEQNPVRAGMVRRARDYPWSSYRANPFCASSKSARPTPNRWLRAGCSCALACSRSDFVRRGSPTWSNTVVTLSSFWGKPSEPAQSFGHLHAPADAGDHHVDHG
jgi:putative transposase